VREKEHPEDVLRRARRVEAIMGEDQPVPQALALMRAAILRAWRKSDVDSTREREILYLRYCAVGVLETTLTRYLEAGKMVMVELAKSEATEGDDPAGDSARIRR